MTQSKFSKGAFKLLDLIRRLSNPWCYASTAYFCKHLEISPRQFYRYRKWLIENGMLTERSYRFYHYEKGRPHTHRELRPADVEAPVSKFKQMKVVIKKVAAKIVETILPEWKGRGHEFVPKEQPACFGGMSFEDLAQGQSDDFIMMMRAVQKIEARDEFENKIRLELEEERRSGKLNSQPKISYHVEVPHMGTPQET